MVTKPHENILYRELAIVQRKEIYADASELLVEIVNFGTSTLVRCMSYSDGEENVDLAPFSLYRHILETTDAIQVLIENGCPAAANPLLRTCFEGLLALEYITEDPALYEQRSLSWLASYAHERLKSYKSLDPNTDAGQKFIEAIEKDKTVHDFPPLPADKVKKAIANMEALLSREQFKEIVSEIKSHPRSRPNWYSLFKGPEHLRKLAQHLNRHLQYDILYRQWSQSAHAQDFFPFIAPGELGEKLVRGLRDLASTNEVVTFATTFLIDSTRLLINKFHPGESWGNWYFREVRDRYLAAAKSGRQN
jgi:hypothetical protein